MNTSNSNEPRGEKHAHEATHETADLCDAPVLVPATPWRRFMCIAYEGILLFGVLFFAGYTFSALAQFKGEPGIVRWIFQGFIFLVLAVYFTWSWSEGRQTLPMKTMGVKLYTANGLSLSISHALGRYIAIQAMLALALCAGSYVHPTLYLLMLLPTAWCVMDRKARTLYDITCSSQLLQNSK